MLHRKFYTTALLIIAISIFTACSKPEDTKDSPEETTKDKDVQMTFDDSNHTVSIMSPYVIDFGYSHTKTTTIYKQPSHGTATAYLIGGEMWSISYTQTDCFIGADTLIYKYGDDYGRINITIESPLTAVDREFSVDNTSQITQKYLIGQNPGETITLSKQSSHGSTTTYSGANQFVFDYVPDNSYQGQDVFEYTLNLTVKGCSLNAKGTVSLDVKQPKHYFSWKDTNDDVELWSSDGTVQGTSRVKNINSTKSSQPYISDITINGYRYFTATSDGYQFNRELWRTDGTENGTQQVVDITPNPGHGSHPRNLTLYKNSIYFFALEGATSTSNNFEGTTSLYKSSGELGNFTKVEMFSESSAYSKPSGLTKLGSALLFKRDADAGNGANWEFWGSNGLDKSFIHDQSVDAHYSCSVQLNKHCYGVGRDDTNGSELWMSNLTLSNVQILKDINEENSQGASGGSAIRNITLAENKFFFLAYDNIHGVGLWVSDGTKAGTKLVKDFFQGIKTDGSEYWYFDKFKSFTNVNGTLLFYFADDSGNQSLWKSDGTLNGTVMVSHDNPAHLTAKEDKLYFFNYGSTDATTGLAISDTSANTPPTILHSFPTSDYEVSSISYDAGFIYIEMKRYSADPANHTITYEYWVTDGTVSGTIKLI